MLNKSFKTGKIVAIALALLAGLALVLAPTCAGAQTPRRITLTPDSLLLSYRDTARIVPTVAPGTAAVTWSSSDTTIATVRAGKITAKAKAGCTHVSGRAHVDVRTRVIACVRAPVVTPPPTDTVVTPDTTTPPPSGGPTVLFATSWAAGTRTDGGRLNEDLPWNPTILAVVPRSTVAGLPTAWPANLLRITFRGQDAQLVAARGLWAAPVAGKAICFRFLLYNALPVNSGVTFEHGMQSNIGDLHHYWQLFSPRTGGASELGFGGSGAGSANFAIVPPARPTRVEHCLTRTTGNRARVELRVTDESTGQVFTNVDFRSNWGESASTLVGREMTFVSEFDGFRSYYFGASGSANASGVSVYVTGFAVCTTWCGSYRAGEGR